MGEPICLAKSFCVNLLRYLPRKTPYLKGLALVAWRNWAQHYCYNEGKGRDAMALQLEWA